jgi:uncharacterized radical SAM protein YgiQ
MYKMKGKDQAICDRCVSPSCIFPTVCYNLDTNHKPMLEIYQETAAHPKVKKAFVSSGIRYDLLVGSSEAEAEANGYDDYVEQLVSHHVSGRLKVAPEHTSDHVLKLMRKPSFKRFHAFKARFDAICKKSGLAQQLIPYFISSHPGCELEDMAHLAAETKALGFELEQVQDFTPTPMTVATVIYYSGYHPYTLKPVKTAKTQAQKRQQKRFFFWYKKDNQPWIRQVLQNTPVAHLVDQLLGPSPGANAAAKRQATGRRRR